MASTVPVCALLSEIIDEQGISGTIRLDIPISPGTCAATCTLVRAQVVRADGWTGSGNGLPWCVTVEIEVEIRCGNRLVVARQAADLAGRRSLSDACGTHGSVRNPKVTVLQQQDIPPQMRHLVLAGSSAGDQFGYATAFVGDLDGDGVSDLAIGAPSTNVGSLINAGSVYLYSGRTGLLIRRIDGAVAEGAFGFAVAAAGDVNGDGRPDILVGAPGPHGGSGQAFIISGRDGTLLRNYSAGESGDQFGWSVCSPGDLDGDGIPDQVIGAPSNAPGGDTDAGSIYLFSGATGSLLARLDGPNPGDAFGMAIGSPGDINGDGVPDLLVGASQASPPGLEQAGRAVLISGQPPYPPLFAWSGQEPGEGFGWLVNRAGDIDGDGIPDLMVGASGTAPGASARPGKLYLFSGATGGLIRLVNGTGVGDSFALAAVPFQSHGCNYQLVGAPDAGPPLSQGRADLLFGTTRLRTFQGSGRFSQFGWSCAADEARQALAIGAPGASPDGAPAAGTVDLHILGTHTFKVLLCVEATLVIERTRQLTLNAARGCEDVPSQPTTAHQGAPP